MTSWGSSGAALEASRLRVRFDPVAPLVLKDITFTLEPGEIVCVVGPNGAGKTTLLRLLAGCLFKTRNKIRVLGLDRWRENRLIREQSTFVPATFDTITGQVPMHHWQVVAKAYKMDEEAFSKRCRELVKDMDYGQHVNTPWQHLSLGLAHKALLIGGFLPPAKLRILDEPVASGIDPMGMEILGVWMKEARARGETILFSTQVLDRAHLLADRLMILGDRHLIFMGAPSELIAQLNLDPTDPYALNQAFFRLFDKGQTK